MSDAWKKFEADSAALFGGKRYWANSGERIDFSGPFVDGQCKLVKTLSLEALTKLVEEVDALAKTHKKVGVVCTKVRRGRGKESPSLVTMSFSSFGGLLSLIRQDRQLSLNIERRETVKAPDETIYVSPPLKSQPVS